MATGLLNFLKRSIERLQASKEASCKANNFSSFDCLHVAHINIQELATSNVQSISVGDDNIEHAN